MPGETWAPTFAVGLAVNAEELDGRYPACRMEAGSLQIQMQTRCLRSQDFSKPLHNNLALILNFAFVLRK